MTTKTKKTDGEQLLAKALKATGPDRRLQLEAFVAPVIDIQRSHNVLWGQAFDLNDPQRSAAATNWLVDQLIKALDA